MRVEEDAVAADAASELIYDVPDSYRAKHGYHLDTGQSEPLGLSVTVGDETSQVAAYRRVQVPDREGGAAGGEIRDIVPICGVDGDTIDVIDPEVEQVLRNYFQREGMVVHDPPLNPGIRAGKYDGILQDEETPTSPYRNGTTPVSRFI